MIQSNSLGRAVAFGLCLHLAGVGAAAQTAAPTPPASKKKAAPKAAPAPAPPLEPKAIEILKAMSERLAAARSLSFTAVATYESPSAFGHVLAYNTGFEVTLQRPDKLKVISVGDGPRSEFYYDGKTMSQLAPAENMIATAEAPPTIDGLLKAAYDSADIYFPFTDFIVADPYGDIAEGLQLVFYIGPSIVVGGTTTDMVALESDGVFLQIWVGREDKLPRMVRAQFDSDPWQLRHQVELSNWQVDPFVATDAFVSSQAAGAKRIEFVRRDEKQNLPPGAQPVGASMKAAPKATPKATPKPQ